MRRRSSSVAQPVSLVGEPPSRRELLRAILVISAVEALVFGIFLPRLGFYVDDWVWLDICHLESGFWRQLVAMATHGNGWIRPFSVWAFPLIYSRFGFHPLVYHVYMLGQDTLSYLLLFVFLRRIFGREKPALLVVVLALCNPAAFATHQWASNQLQVEAHNLFITSLLLHLHWLSAKDKRYRAASVVAFMAALLCYEDIAFMPLILTAGLLGRQLRFGVKWRVSWPRAAGPLIPYGLAFAAVTFWQRIGIGWVHVQNPKTVQISASFMLKTYADAADCLSRRVYALCASAFPGLGHELDWTLVMLGVAAAVALSALAFEREEARPSSSPAIALWLGGAAFLAAYAPFALSGNYILQTTGVMSRTNGWGTLAESLLLFAVFGGLSRFRKFGVAAYLRQGALALMVACFTFANWHTAIEWGKAWSLEQDILGKIRPKVLGLPPSSIVLLGGTPMEINGAPVFNEYWDFKAALRFATGRSDLQGEIATAFMILEKNGVVERIGSQVLRSFPYANLFLYNFSKDSIMRVLPPS